MIFVLLKQPFIYGFIYLVDENMPFGLKKCPFQLKLLVFQKISFTFVLEIKKLNI